jgi:hypothetical protein
LFYYKWDFLILDFQSLLYTYYNILTNEYMNVECEFKKLKKIIECLIYSKYITNKPITDDDFIKLNKKIYNLYFM